MARRRQRPKRVKRQEDPINENIKAPKIRLVGDNLDDISDVIGQEILSGVYPTKAARQWAEEMGLDLVLISAKADPPVCKITDYNKFLYLQKKKQKEMKAKSAKTVVKEIRFGPNTDDHDFNFKLNHAKGFLEDGAKVKVFVHFKGRTIVFKERGELLLLRFIKELEDYGTAESLPKMEGKRMIVMIVPKVKKK
ncbi:MAG: translation initiation factor IF-3 [Saprospirales bacterium]|nr:MAG: translation initiation factor IF-3 [Saprospirales bacterium]